MTRHTSQAEIQHKRIDRMFGDRTAPTEVQLWETKRNANCDIHGRRGSGGSIRSLSQRRDSTASSLYSGGGGGGREQHQPVHKRDSIGSTILLNNSSPHWNTSFKRDSTPAAATSVSLHNLASDLRSSLARIESLDSPDRSSRATTPKVQRPQQPQRQYHQSARNNFSNGVRAPSMPVLNQSQR